MPIWLRRFTFNKIKDWYDRKNEDNTPPPSYKEKLIKGPDIRPTYTAKASSK